MKMPTKYTVAIHGTGKRGKVHAETFCKDGRFEVVAICGRNRERLDAAALLAGDPKRHQDPAQMLRETKPDIFCFCTPPSLAWDWYSKRGHSTTQMLPSHNRT